jgi:hypothetical protein
LASGSRALTRIALCGGLLARKGVALRASRLEENGEFEGNSKLVGEAFAIIREVSAAFKETGAV